MDLGCLLEWSLRARGYFAADLVLGAVRLRYLATPGARNVGPPIVLIHGIGSRAVHFHDTLVALARSGHPVYALDLPGHGASSELVGPCTSEVMLGALENFLDRIVGGPFVLVGNSLGGALALGHAVRRPQRVLGVVAASPAVGFRSVEDWEALRARLSMTTPAEARDFVRSVFHREPRALPLLARMFLTSMQRRSVRELLARAAPPDLALETADVNVPTLVIWGKSERVFPRRNLDGLKALLPAAARFEEPENIGHCPHLDDPAWFAQRILEQVRSLSPRRRESVRAAPRRSHSAAPAG